MLPLALFQASKIWSKVAPVRALISLKTGSRGPPGCLVTGLMALNEQRKIRQGNSVELGMHEHERAVCLDSDTLLLAILDDGNLLLVNVGMKKYLWCKEGGVCR